MYAVGRVIPTTKKAQHNARAGGGVDLSALHARKQIFAGVLRCPHGSKPRGAQFPVGVEPRHARVAGAHPGLGVRELAKEVVLFSSGEGGVVVGAANHAKSIGIGADASLQREAALQSGPCIRAGVHVRRCFCRIRDVVLIPALEIGKGVVRRETGVGFAIAFELRDFCDRLPAHAALRVVGVDRVAIVGDGVPHEAVAEIAIVRNRERFSACGLFVLQ